MATLGPALSKDQAPRQKDSFAREVDNTWKGQGMYPTPGHLAPAHHTPQQLQVGLIGDWAKPIPPQMRKL